MSLADKKLKLKFHGRIVDHLGIQMYQSPVASLAELISNAWDADAECVEITLPRKIGPDATITIRDTGVGMTFQECEERYLNVGYCRRGDTPAEKTAEKRRSVLGRKGIGKFAGFGIASTITIDTTSKATGERTQFLMRLNDIRSEQYYAEGGDVPLLGYLEADEQRKPEHGTTVTLNDLTLNKTINPSQFAKSMARRFLLHQRQADFKILVNSSELPDGLDFGGVEYVFPRDYRDDEKPPYLGQIDAGGWGIEKIDFNREIRWRMLFYKETIDEEELRGISVFVHGKTAQSPFLFHIAGGLKGQHGIEYLAGQIEASYLDEQPIDLISTDRQSINWEQPESIPLREWGVKRVKELLKIWQDRRSEERRTKLEEKLGNFAARLEVMTKSEAKTIRTALLRLASITTLTDDQFQELGGAMLTSFERGRLKNLIDKIANTEIFTAEDFVEVLVEADILSALNLTDVIKTKLEAIRGLERMVEKRELENKVRDYIAERPWLLNPRWETYKKEVSLKHVMDEAAKKAGLTDNALGQRIDLALRSDRQLLIVEFMRPKKPVDWDHLSRCQRYIYNIRAAIEVQTALKIDAVSGLLVADKLDDAPDVRKGIEFLHKDGIEACEWDSLVAEAKREWQEYFDIVLERAPEDKRVTALKNPSPLVQPVLPQPALALPAEPPGLPAAGTTPTESSEIIPRPA